MKNLIYSLLVFLLISIFQHSTAQWVPCSNGMGLLTVYAFASSDGNIFAAATGHSVPRSVFISSDLGMNWTQTSLNQLVYSLTVNGNYLFAGTQGNGVFVTSNNGTNWSQTPLNNRTVQSLATSGIFTFAGIDAGFEPAIYKSTNFGISWLQSGLDYASVRSLAVSPGYIYAGTYSTIFLSTNNGLNWTQTSLTNREIFAITVNEINIFAGTGSYGVYTSTNNGANWIQTSLNNLTVLSLTVNSNDVIAGTSGNGIYVSNNNGANWTLRNEGLGDLYVYSLFILNDYVFAGTEIRAYRRPLSELTGVKQISNEIPDKFSLSQNYPNPFNPSTKIKFEIPNLSSNASIGDSKSESNSKTEIRIYDVLGREVAMLVNEQLSPGKYEVEWDAANYPSGIYYFKLISGDYSNTKKMILLK